MHEFAVIDTETTGLPNRPYNRILEVAVVRLSPSLTVIDEFETLLNPERDLGPTSIHGITAKSVLAAPRFQEIAGDLMDRIHGCVIVAHNALFDLMFLAKEFERLGFLLPKLPYVCTMAIAGQLGQRQLSRDLENCCSELGISHSTPHRALSDARATAELFRFAAKHMFPDGTIDFHRLNCADKIPWSVECSELNRTGRTWRRDQAEAESAGPCQYLSRIVYRLAGLIRLHDVEPQVAAYLEALERVLEDRVLTPDEADTLYETAAIWDLKPEEVVEAHRLFVRRLAIAALADGVLSDAELNDLNAVNGMFGFGESFLLEALQEAKTFRAPKSPEHESLVGKTVCFTGELKCTLRGECIERELAQELASKAGLCVKGGISKMLDILVVADPHSQSGKAKKAREYGIRILHEPVFWQMIGVKVD